MQRHTQKKWSYITVLSLWFFSAFMQGAKAVTDTEGEASNDYNFVIGRISAHPSSSLEGLRAMNDYLRKLLPNSNNMSFEEVVVSSLPEMERLLAAGKVDLLSETPIGAVELEKSAGAEIILREWKKGVAQYASLLVVHKDSDLNSMGDLINRVVAFEDPGSTSGFFIPLAAFKQSGIKAIQLNYRTDKPPAGTAGYVFAGVEINIASLVARKIVDAGAISDLNWNDLHEVPSGFRDRLNVIYRSEYVPRSTVLVRSGLPGAIKNEIIRIFRDMHLSEEGTSAMQKYHGVARFDPIDEKLEAQFEKVRKMHQLIQGYIR